MQVLQGKVLEAYRNTFANLALPLFAVSEPVPAKKTKFKDMEWTLWDRWVLEGDFTVQVPCSLVSLHETCYDIILCPQSWCIFPIHCTPSPTVSVLGHVHANCSELHVLALSCVFRTSAVAVSFTHKQHY